MKQDARIEQLKKKTNAEIVKHPQNNHVWMHLASFINHKDELDLDDIAERKKERQAIREEIETKKQFMKDL